ncbi:Uncharacterised protein [Mycobacteroides abscessus subsp. abscessus]|nr:Uncharacterised protein [Mycobacteroides abscessus subsp. abscessus]
MVHFDRILLFLYNENVFAYSKYTITKIRHSY